MCIRDRMTVLWRYCSFLPRFSTTPFPLQLRTTIFGEEILENVVHQWLCCALTRFSTTPFPVYCNLEPLYLASRIILTLQNNFSEISLRSCWSKNVLSCSSFPHYFPFLVPPLISHHLHIQDKATLGRVKIEKTMLCKGGTLWPPHWASVNPRSKIKIIQDKGDNISWAELKQKRRSFAKVALSGLPIERQWIQDPR